MPIIGTTVGEDGRPILRLPVTRKIACGIGPSGQRNHPERLFKFLLMERGSGKEWIVDTEAMKRYSPKCNHAEVTDQCEHCCTEIKVMLISDPIDDGKGNLDFENILRTSLTWWGRTGWKCRGDGVNAIRRTEKNPEGEPWSLCRLAGCPDWDVDCGASGDLFCVLGDQPPSGGITRIHTSSEWSIRNIHSALLNICTYTGNRLAGVTIPLKVTKEKATPKDKKTGKTMETWVPILSVSGSIPQLVEDSKKTLELYNEARKMFGGRALTPYEDEGDLANEIPKEFPVGQDQKSLPETTTQTTAQPDTPKVPADPPKTQPAATSAPQQDSQPATEKPKEEKPKVLKTKSTYEGMPKSFTEDTIKQGNSKGHAFWRVVVALEHGDMEFLVFSKTVMEKIEGAIKRSQAIQMPCEVSVQETGTTRNWIKVLDVDFVAKAPEPAKQEPPVSDGDMPPWMLE